MVRIFGEIGNFGKEVWVVRFGRRGSRVVGWGVLV